MLKRKPLRSRYTSVSLCPSRTTSGVITPFQRLPERSTAHSNERFAPTPTSIRISMSGRDAQRPYGLIRSHDVCAEPQHLCRFIGVRHVAIPAPWLSELSGAPGITLRLHHVLLLDGGVSCPYTPSRLSRLFQESLQRQSPCAG
jgi:hypothetical protein